MKPPIAGSVQMRAESAPKFKGNCTHGPSGSAISTEAPKDNGGTGSSFSPTDLVGAALASCALTTMQLAASREGIPWGVASARVEKVMTPPPRRIGALPLEIRMPSELPRQQRSRFEDIARACPVARSLGSEVQVLISFVYPD